GTWTSDSDVDIKLTQTGSTWTLIDRDDTVETYTAAGTGQGLLTSISARNGYTQNLAYGTGNKLLSVTDSFNRALSFFYDVNNGMLGTLRTPDGLDIVFGYDSS